MLAGYLFGIVTSVAHHLLSISKCLSPPHLPQKRLLRDYHGKKQAAMGAVMEGHMAFDLAKGNTITIRTRCSRWRSAQNG